MSPALDLDHDACYRAIASRDPRFDGRLFIGVKTTGTLEGATAHAR